MKRRIVLMISVILVCMAGCGQGERDTVYCDGSTAMGELVEALSEAYKRDGGGIINVSGSGSGAGIQAVLTGMCDIGLSSRELTEEEKVKGAKGHIVALDGIAVIINLENPVSELTMVQLKDIYTGKVMNWKEVGGVDAPVAVLGREAGSGTRDAFEVAVGAVGECVHTCEYNATGDVVGGVSRNQNAIGYVSLSAVGEGVKALPLDGVSCTLGTVQNGSYPISRPFIFVVNSSVSPAAKRFLNFVLGPKAEEIILLTGMVPQGGGGP